MMNGWLVLFEPKAPPGKGNEDKKRKKVSFLSLCMWFCDKGSWGGWQKWKYVSWFFKHKFIKRWNKSLKSSFWWPNEMRENATKICLLICLVTTRTHCTVDFSCIFVSKLSVATRNTETKIQGKILCALTEQLSSMHFSCKVNQPQLGWIH